MQLCLYGYEKGPISLNHGQEMKKEVNGGLTRRLETQQVSL